jgi:hypothetical protein
MKLSASDPDIQTLVTRIKNGDIDLQPDFQRGEVWSESKKRRLIDTILRDWHVPPVHTVEIEGDKSEVLDGQQRLAAIRDFVNGDLTVDGTIEPIDPELLFLNGFDYEGLPPHLRRRFDKFPIRLLRITDYKPEEPPELFYRLNQPTSLTAAEQRNAFFGPVRLQIRELVKRMREVGLDESTIGFSNSRMGYDDIIAKVCLCTEWRTMAEKITAGVITERYRSGQAFKEKTISIVEGALRALSSAISACDSKTRFNKATLFSWICFVIRTRFAFSGISSSERFVAEYFCSFERRRRHGRRDDQSVDGGEHSPGREDAIDQLLAVYNDRASARVADVASVLARDIVLSLLFVDHALQERKRQFVNAAPYKLLTHLTEGFDRPSSNFGEEVVFDVITSSNWGSLP